MRTAVKVTGVLLVLVGLRSLFQSDGLGFVMFLTLGIGLMMEPKPGGRGVGARWALLSVAFVLALVRIVSFVIG
jgi:hypothetical protein